MKNTFIFLFLFSFFFTNAQTANITSWIRNTTSAVNPSYPSLECNVQSVYFTTTDVYVSSSSVPGYTIGPWTANPNTPADKNFISKFTRNPIVNNGTKTNTGLGSIGIWTNGVSLFNAKDGQYWNGTAMSNGISNTGWNRNAYYWEGISFDACKGHPGPDGTYHHHIAPSCLYNQTNTTTHSPIIGYAWDGFPIYGAYAYTNTDGTGLIKRMVSSYILSSISSRSSGTNGTSQSGPPINATYPLGSMCEDYVYTAGSGDLDQYNGRTCITPEYPAGTYAYFVTIDASGVAAYPFVLSSQYYGTVASTSTNQVIPGTAVQYTGQVLPVNIYNLTVQIENKRNAKIVWNVGVENNVKEYQIEKSNDGVTFKLLTIINANGQNFYSYSDNNVSNEKLYYRIKTIDNDGTYKYSNIVSINLRNADAIIVHNNPAKDILTIQSNNASAKRKIELINSAGQVVLISDMPQGITMKSFNIQTLYAGIYFLNVNTLGNIQTIKIFIGN